MTASAAGLTRAGLHAAARQVLPDAVFVAAPALAVCLLLRASISELPAGIAFWDFHGFWDAGRAVLHGRSPYPPVQAAALFSEQSFVYPAPAALLVAPFALLPFMLAATLFALLSVAALLLALQLVGVRDRRCYGLALVSAPILTSISLGAISPLLVLGLAVAWRYRDRRLAAAAAVAALIVLKLFLWPLLLWLAFTRRLATAVWAAALACATSLAAWAALGFDGLRAYPHLLTLLARLLEGKGYSLVALGLSLGAGATAARALSVAAGAAALSLVAVRGRGDGAAQWTFAAAIGASLALSPIVWLHYFSLLVVPVAISSPRLSPLWFGLLAFWILGGQNTDGPIWGPTLSSLPTAGTRAGPAWLVVYGVAAAVGVLALSARRSPALPRAGPGAPPPRS